MSRPPCEFDEMAPSAVGLDAGARSSQLRTDLRVLFVQHASDLSGSTISGQLVSSGFRQALWHVDAVFGSVGAGIAAYDRLGCVTHVTPHKNWLRGGNSIQSVRRIITEAGASQQFVRLARQFRPDVIYVNSIVSLAAAVAARRLRIPCVWHIREQFDDVGGEMRIPPCGGKSLVRRVIATCADHTVLLSDAARDNVLGKNWGGKASVVPNAADDCFFELAATPAECRALFGLPERGMIVGVPGTLRPVKGHEFFLNAAAAVAVRGATCDFVITGDGEPKYFEKLQHLAGELGLTGRVRFLGAVTRMPEFYRACDLVCIPSQAEAFGRTVIEAFAAGVPVVASAVGGMRETVDHGTTGLLVDFGDVSGMSDALIQLLENPGLRQRLAAAAHLKARTHYSAGIYRDRINRIVTTTVEARERKS
jgi:glycosyltransferase involved in cell wall biosynthesis